MPSGRLISKRNVERRKETRLSAGLKADNRPLYYIIDILRFGAPYLRRYWLVLVAGVAFSMIYGVSNGGLVWGTKTILDRLSPPPPQATQAAGGEAGSKLERLTYRAVDPWLPRVGRKIDPRQVVGGLLFLPFVVGLRGFSRYVGAWSMAYLSENVVNDLRCDVLRKLQSLSMDYFNRSTMGDLLMRVNGDTAALNQCLSVGFTDSIVAPFTMISIVAYLCSIDWKLTLASMILTPLCLIPISTLGRRARKAGAIGTAARISQSSLLVEMLSGIRIVKALNLEAEQTQRFREFSKQLVRSSVNSARAREQINPIIETFSMLGLGLLIIYVFFSHRTTPEMVAFLSGILLFFLSLKKLAALHIVLHELKLSVDRLAQILAEKPTVKEKPDARPLSGFWSAIRFRDVSFAYHTQTVLEHVDLEIRRGTKIGIAGENGSGKSTLMNLLLRFYDPTTGLVQIAGVDLCEMHVSDLRNLIGIFSQ
jgi:subfamily B ATP-binding cassette protein MsbA